MRYVAFLASVNVGGNQVKMADLKDALEDCGLERVETVVASGNVLFDYAGASDAALEKRIGDCVAERFGFRTFAAVRSAAELEAALAENPLVGGNAEKFVYVHFLAERLTPAAFERLEAAHKGPEKLAAGKRDLYMDYVEGAGRSKLTGAFLEKHLGCRGTGRNIRSIKRILEKMAS